MNTEEKPKGHTRMDSTRAAEYLGRSRSWLDKARAAGRGPRYIAIGKRVFYRAADLDAYVESRVRETEDTRSAA